MSLTVTILGCGSSAGVPQVGQGWGACDPNNSKNRRRRCSLLVERAGPAGRTRVLVDTSPDLREQLLDADVRWLDGVLYTHDHADHTHGIDDLRPLVLARGRRINTYMDKLTEEIVMQRFSYCFTAPSGGEYPPILQALPIAAGAPVRIVGDGGEVAATPFAQVHGGTSSLGFRFGRLAYSCDLSDIPAESLETLQGLDVWILDALRYRPHPSHFSVDDALAWIERVRPKRAVLTNLHFDLDFDTLRAALPSSVEPAYDGMQIVLDA
jgi:phosphoribosyl 1,2-cyclic phosphate phosphodiesterase